MDDNTQKTDSTGNGRQRVYNVGSGQLNAEERLELVKILARAGYAARVGRERPDGKPQAAYVYFVEYWNEN